MEGGHLARRSPLFSSTAVENWAKAQSRKTACDFVHDKCFNSLFFSGVLHPGRATLSSARRSPVWFLSNCWDLPSATDQLKLELQTLKHVSVKTAGGLEARPSFKS